MAKSKTSTTRRSPKAKPELTFGQQILKGLDEATRHFQGEDVGAKETRVKLTPLQVCMRKLREARQKAGLTLAEVAERSGVRLETVSRLELGKYRNPTIDTLERIATAVGVKLEITIRACSGGFAAKNH